MLCIHCNKFDKKNRLCNANLFEDEVSDSCLLKQIIQNLRLAEDCIEDGEEWKYQEGTTEQ